MTHTERDGRLEQIAADLEYTKRQHEAGMIPEGLLVERLAKLAVERSALLDLGNGQAEPEAVPAAAVAAPPGALTLREVARVAAEAWLIVAAELKRAASKGA